MTICDPNGSPDAQKGDLRIDHDLGCCSHKVLLQNLKSILSLVRARVRILKILIF